MYILFLYCSGYKVVPRRRVRRGGGEDVVSMLGEEEVEGSRVMVEGDCGETMDFRLATQVR